MHASRVETRIKIAGIFFRLRFSTRETHAALFPALEHLAMEQDAAQPDDFTVNIWDSVSMDVWPPRPPWAWEKSTTKGEIAGLGGPRFHGHFNHTSGATSIFDSEARAAIFWMPDISVLHGADRAAPLLQIFQWSFERMGLQITHGAVAGIPSGAALLAGKGGSGKSTTAALAREAGLLHMGDDYCLLGADPSRVHAFYRSVKLAPRSLDLAPLSARRGRQAWMSDEKNVLLLDGEYSRELPLKIILLPRVIGHGPTTARPASAAEALRAIAPSTLFQLAGTSPSTFQFFARLAKQLPAFHLDLGTDAENVGARIRDLLERATP